MSACPSDASKSSLANASSARPFPLQDGPAVTARGEAQIATIKPNSTRVDCRRCRELVLALQLLTLSNQRLKLDHVNPDPGGLIQLVLAGRRHHRLGASERIAEQALEAVHEAVQRLAS